ncbi:hypothetical protein ABK040_012834 [Willaertia magna]
MCPTNSLIFLICVLSFHSSITQAQKVIEGVSGSELDTGWTLINGALVMFMQAGFAFLEAGSVRSKNVANILLKTVMSVAISTMSFYCIGYGLAFGDTKTETRNGFYGNGSFFLLGDESLHVFFFQWSFAAVASTIVSGAVAERTNLSAFFMCSFLMTSFVYAPVAHWMWSTTGWLSPFNKEMFRVGTVGVVDFAGGVVVHYVGGICGLVGAIMVGPRIGRFVNGKAIPIDGHNKTLVLLGGLILWFGWYGFNAGSTTALSNGLSLISSYASTNTTIAAASGAIMSMFWSCLKSGQYDLTESLNGCLAACVGITPICAFVQPWASVIVGATSALVYFFGVFVLESCYVDDPCVAVPIHAFCGAWGVFLGGLFATKEQIIKLYSLDSDLSVYGLFYSGNWEMVAVNIFGIVIIGLWVAFSSVIMFYFIDLTIGLRVPAEDELVGLDHKYGGSAFNVEDEEYGYSATMKSQRSGGQTTKSGGGSSRHRNVY